MKKLLFLSVVAVSALISIFATSPHKQINLLTKKIMTGESFFDSNESNYKLLRYYIEDEDALEVFKTTLQKSAKDKGYKIVKFTHGNYFHNDALSGTNGVTFANEEIEVEYLFLGGTRYRLLTAADRRTYIFPNNLFDHQRRRHSSDGEYEYYKLLVDVLDKNQLVVPDYLKDFMEFNKTVKQ